MVQPQQPPTDYQLLKGDIGVGATSLTGLVAGAQAGEARERLGIAGSTGGLPIAPRG